MTTAHHTVIILFLVFSSGCAALYQAAAPLPPPVSSAGDSTIEMPAEIALRSKKIIEAVEKRNQTIEKDPEWIQWAYSGIGLKKLTSLPSEKYAQYARYLDNGMIYIVVHPAYYVFFHKNVPVVRRGTEHYASNMLDLFIKETPDNPVLKVIQQQQIYERSFIEYISTEGKLLILILPKDYRKHPNYAYPIRDEYARYINEITNASESVLYLESVSSSSGKLPADDLITLLSFINRTGAKSVLVGGGYVGRCQKEFYTEVMSYATAGNFFIAPEISVFSPEDISENRAVRVFDDKNINFQAASEFIISKMDGHTNILHLSPWLTNACAEMASPRRADMDDFVTLRKENDPAGQAGAGVLPPPVACPLCFRDVPSPLFGGASPMNFFQALQQGHDSPLPSRPAGLSQP